MRAVDLTHVRFGRIVAIQSLGANIHGSRTWECRCDCGMSLIATTGQLTSGNTKSCGCLKRDVCRSEKQPPEKRFATAYVRSDSGCWLWNTTSVDRRYGSFYLHGERMPAHRASWILHRGKIPDGLHVLHKCDVTLCVNPEHLFLGTHADNMADKKAKGRTTLGRKIRAANISM